MNFQLYRICRGFFRLATKFFFRKIEISGLEKISGKGPSIIVANHAASFLDPIVIAIHLRFPVFFIAKARLMNRGLPRWFLRFFNVIPVYRAQDDPSKMDKNQIAFEACFRHLERGGSLIIFPEGISHSVRNLMKIKTGAARIALGAEARNEFGLNVRIIPFGLNYSNQEKFQSKLFISVSDPIYVRDFEKEYLKEEVGGVNELTAMIENGINQSIINAGDERRDTTARRVERLMKSRILADWGASEKSLDQDHKVNQRILQAMDYLQTKDPVRFTELEREANEYFERLRDVDLPETIFKSKRLTKRAIALYLLYFLPGLPFHLAGLAGNFVPYQMAIFMARAWSRYKEYRGAAGFISGIVVFVTAYFFEWKGLMLLTGSTWITLLVMLSMPFLGVFSFYYWRKFRRFYYKVVFSYAKKRIFIRRLISQRNHIIDELESVRQDFLAAEASESSQ